MSHALRDLPLLRVLYDETLRPVVPHAASRPPRLRDQHSTGQCWLHAGVGLLETASDALETRYPDVVCLYKQSLVRLVQWVHERLADASLDDRTRQHLLDRGIDDGATWGTFAWIVTTHGVRTLPRPRRDWPHAAQNSRDLLSLLRSQLRCGASVDDMTRTIERCLPDAQGDVRTETLDLSNYFEIMNAPHLPLNRWYATFFDLSEGDDVAYNVSMDDLVSACRKMLESKRVVWASFCIDHEFDWDRLQAGGDPRNDVVPLPPARDRARRVERRDLTPDHAMLVVGYADGVWRIHNSWGKPARQTYTRASVVDDEDDASSDVLATDEWFRTHLFHAVVHTDVVRKPEQDDPPHRLPSWDVLSTVAKLSRRSTREDRTAPPAADRAAPPCSRSWSTSGPPS